MNEKTLVSEWTEEEIQALEEACDRADESDLRAFGLTREEEENLDIMLRDIDDMHD